LPAAPVAWNGLVIIGTAAGDFGVRGRIVALDALSGREVWRFNTVPVGDEAQSNTWKTTRWNEHGGGGSWSTYTIDVTTGEVFVPVGNPVPDFTPADRPGTNLFTNSVVVLDAVTGKLRWWYQLKTNDSADHDLAAAPLLYRDKNGQERVAAAGKDGYLHIIDRASHSLVAKTAVTTVDAVPAPASTTGVRVCPGAAGGVEWNGPAYDPEHQLLFVGAVDLCSIIRSTPGSKYTPGGLNYGGSWSFTADRPSGWITAVDSTTGAVAWKYHASAPVLSGITATAGNIVFGGDNSGHFVIFESTTGKLLKDIATGGSLSGGVVTYEISGKQYVAFTSGNISRTVFGATGRPTIIVMAIPTSEDTRFTTRRDDASRGQQLFYGLCAGCHGSDGKNIDGYDLSTVKTRMNFAQIIEWIKHPAPPMPRAFPDPPNASEVQDLRDLATFLHETIK
jgi:alcohol dehydrogenase (cytochrome c)